MHASYDNLVNADVMPGAENTGENKEGIILELYHLGFKRNEEK